MDDREDAVESFEVALDNVSTAEYAGIVFMDINTIPAVNLGVLTALDSRVHPEMSVLSEEFIGGVIFALDIYRRIHDGLLMRHAADIVPDYIPDGMDDTN